MATGFTGKSKAALLSALLAPLATANAAAADRFVLEASLLDGTMLAALKLDAEQGWCLHWTHSVARFPVRDCYVIRGGEMVLDSSHQPDFAAGLGHFEGRGIVRSGPDGGYLIEDINEPVPGNCLRLRVGSMAVNHQIAAGDTVTSLSDLAERKSVRITLRKSDEETNGQC
ncbi:DUF1850 domain-containing protein [Pelagibacterium lentulum]|uniref:DUF1850 domain-containing protein n=1 Tax=Pelagibacterium lentulum TaxID=2029865 RepID=A0A916W2U2_9HYPH|nr:DUF1850 domain-containing protein [Pelagibacterium lentulum]GGA61621.1 hypothetical protein GCM10011499_34970 [Pelagibacterium lentulum]